MTATQSQGQVVNWVNVLPALLALLKSLGDVFRSSSPPPPPVVVSVPDPTQRPPLLMVAPDQAVKGLQTFLNAVLQINPPLAVDGWLGPKTDAAIEAGIARLKTFGIG
jgi:hypothetical protein